MPLPAEHRADAAPHPVVALLRAGAKLCVVVGVAGPLACVPLATGWEPVRPLFATLGGLYVMTGLGRLPLAPLLSAGIVLTATGWLLLWWTRRET